MDAGPPRTFHLVALRRERLPSVEVSCSGGVLKVNGLLMSLSATPYKMNQALATGGLESVQ